MDDLNYRWINMVYIFYTTYISGDLAHCDVFSHKCGMGGIKYSIQIITLKLEIIF